MAIEVFNRYEYKYIITPQQYEQLEKILVKELELDEYCNKNTNYNIINYYVDTLNHQMIRDSLDKPLYKQKLRIRTYEKITNDKDFVYFELKKKYKGLVNKRRCQMKYHEAIDLIYKNKLPKYQYYMNQQILKEIYYVLQRDTYEIKSEISYSRIAYFSQDKQLRISFDFDIESTRLTYLEANHMLMEIKTPGAIPLWLVNILNDLKIQSQSFSKYGLDFKEKLRREVL